MKIKIRPDDASARRETDWLQMNDWLAELREDDRAEPIDPENAAPPAHSDAEPAGSGDAESSGHGPAEPDGGVLPPALSGPAARDAPAVPTVAAVSAAPAGPVASAAPAAPVASAAPAEPVASAAPAAPVASAASTAPAAPARPAAPATPTAVRPLIGDQLRMPVMWCELGSCISWHADPAALGEADARARAISAGWRLDAFGRLACPLCQQTDPGYWAACRVVPWDRYMAIARTARITAVHADRAADSSHDPRYPAESRQPAWAGTAPQAPGRYDPSRLPAPPPFARRD